MDSQDLYDLKQEVDELKKQIKILVKHNEELNDKLTYREKELYDFQYNISNENLATISLSADKYIRVGKYGYMAGIEGANKPDDIVFWAGQTKPYDNNGNMLSMPYYVKANGNFNFGSSEKYIKWDGSDLNVKGNILMTGGSISWENITSDPAISNAEDAAYDAYDRADSAYSRAGTALNNIIKLANGTYTGYTFIDGTTISSPTVRGGYVIGGKFIAVDNPNADVINNDTPGYKRLIMGSNGISCYNASNMLDGIFIEANDGFGALRFLYENEPRGQIYQDSGNLWIKPEQRLKIGNPTPTPGTVGDVWAVGEWSFSNAVIKDWGDNGVPAVFA